jgi:hypothetical protein
LHPQSNQEKDADWLPVTVKLLLFVIGVADGIDVDKHRWEKEFSFTGDGYKVMTRVYELPKVKAGP